MRLRSSIRFVDWHLLFLVIVTSSLCINTLLGHLRFAAGGLQNVNLSTISEVFPVTFLMLGAPLIFIGGCTNGATNHFAFRITFFGTTLALVYYILMMCILSLAYAPGLFVFTQVGLIEYTIPTAMLIILLRYTTRKLAIIKSSKS